MQFEPFGPRILVKPIDPVAVDLVKAEKAGILVPESVRDDVKARLRATTGIIVAVAQDVNELFTTGQEVVFTRHAGQPYTFEGIDFLILDDRDVLGINHPKPLEVQ